MAPEPVTPPKKKTGKKTPTWLYVAGVSALGLAYVLWKKKQAAAATADASNQTSTAPVVPAGSYGNNYSGGGLGSLIGSLSSQNPGGTATIPTPQPVATTGDTTAPPVTTTSGPNTILTEPLADAQQYLATNTPGADAQTIAAGGGLNTADPNLSDAQAAQNQAVQAAATIAQNTVLYQSAMNELGLTGDFNNLSPADQNRVELQAVGAKVPPADNPTIDAQWAALSPAGKAWVQAHSGG